MSSNSKNNQTHPSYGVTRSGRQFHLPISTDASVAFATSHDVHGDSPPVSNITSLGSGRYFHDVHGDSPPVSNITSLGSGRYFHDVHGDLPPVSNINSPRPARYFQDVHGDSPPVSSISPVQLVESHRFVHDLPHVCNGNSFVDFSSSIDTLAHSLSVTTTNSRDYCKVNPSRFASHYSMPHTNNLNSYGDKFRSLSNTHTLQTMPSHTNGFITPIQTPVHHTHKYTQPRVLRYDDHDGHSTQYRRDSTDASRRHVRHDDDDLDLDGSSPKIIEPPTGTSSPKLDRHSPYRETQVKSACDIEQLSQLDSHHCDKTDEINMLKDQVRKLESYISKLTCRGYPYASYNSVQNSDLNISSLNSASAATRVNNYRNDISRELGAYPQHHHAHLNISDNDDMNAKFTHELRTNQYTGLDSKDYNYGKHPLLVQNACGMRPFNLSETINNDNLFSNVNAPFQYAGRVNECVSNSITNQNDFIAHDVQNKYNCDHIQSHETCIPAHTTKSMNDSFDACLQATRASKPPIGDPKLYEHRSNPHFPTSHPLVSLLGTNNLQDQVSNIAGGFAFNSECRASSETGISHHDTFVNSIDNSVVHETVKADRHILATNNNLFNSNKMTFGTDIFPSELSRKFSGDPLEFESWRIRISQEIIDKGYKPNIACEYILSQTSGVVRNVVLQIASIEFNSTWNLVLEIMKDLKTQFAQDHMVRQAIEKEIARHPAVTEDLDSINAFIRLARKIDLHKSVCGDLVGYDMAEGTATLRAKLPRAIQDDYGRKWKKYEERFKSPPPLSFLIEVVKQYRSKSLSSRYAPVVPKKDRTIQFIESQDDSQILASKERGNKLQFVRDNDKNIPINSNPIPFQSKSRLSNNPSGMEPFCSWHGILGHFISECKGFLKLNTYDRREFIKGKGLCLNCLKPNHVASHCPSDILCKMCGSRHHHLLHFERKNTPKELEARVGCTTVCGDSSLSSFCTKVLLVDLALASDPENSIRVYAIIDDQSDTTVVDEKVAEYFGGSYPKRDIITKFVTNEAVFKHEAKTMPDLLIKGVRSTYAEKLKGALTYPSVANNKHQVASPEIVKRFTHTAKYSRYFPELDQQAPVWVLVGLDNIHIHKSDRLTKLAPYVHKTPLGYALVGKVCDNDKENKAAATIMRTQTINVSECPLEYSEWPKIKSTFSQTKLNPEFDVMEKLGDDEMQGLSADDKTFLNLMEKGESVSKSGKLTYPLPIVQESGLPDNRDVVYRRSLGTLRNLKKSKDKLDAVLKILENDIQSGHVEQLNQEKRKVGSDWYLPPFVVTHKRKGTPRVVYDAAAEFQGVSLNKLLLPGPDLLTGLREVLMRFREKNVAVSADIRGMFLNFNVSPEHRQFLKFFWFCDNDPNQKLVPYQINTHAFGLKSSPAVANYALKSIANDSSFPRSSLSSDPIRRALSSSFYVDDLLTSTDTSQEAEELLLGVSKKLSEHGILLHKFASNDENALKHLPEEYWAVGMTKLPNEDGEQSALGVRWDTSTDSLSVSLKLPDREFTKRGILSVIGSLYDPMGFISPIIIGGRLFQREVLPRKTASTELTVSHLGWDDPLPVELRDRWESWCDGLKGLENLSIPRCLHPTNITPVKQWLCAFSDASEDALGFVIYLLTQDSDDKLHLGFVCGNSRVTPRLSTTIPRMELNAAVLAARSVSDVKAKLSRKISGCIYFTDSRIVLGYITNKSKRFSKYVERRASAIRDLTNCDDWFYVATKNNPADLATRPTTPEQLAKSIWFTGPQFLIDGSTLDNRPENNVPETIETKSINATKLGKASFNLCDAVFQRTNDLNLAAGIARRALILLHKLDIARQRLGFQLAPREPFPLVACGVIALSKISQREHYLDEITALKNKSIVSMSSSIYGLSPWISLDGLLRMDGRLENSGLPWTAANPIIIHKSSKLAQAIVFHYHRECHHQGTTITRNSISRGGFHISGGSRLVKSILYKCVMCRRLRGKAQEQKMSALPAVRVTVSPPFTNVGVDLFGPFHIKNTQTTRRHNSTVKMWGCVFTCMSSRAVHLEALSSLDASSFINALTRFCALRGYPKLIKSDRGGNFVSSSKKLGGIDTDTVSSRLEKLNIRWEFNPPHASHFGGVWERVIGSTRRVMEGMMAELHHKSLDLESFLTLLAESSRIINFTPLWVTSWECGDPAPLCPADVLLISRGNEDMECQTVTERDLLAYGPRRHYRALYLVSMFWRRWEEDYLITLNQRSKWFRKTDIEVGDVVLMVDESTSRSSWPLAIISATHPGADGRVRSVTLRLSGTPPRYLERPISKTISVLPIKYQTEFSNGEAISMS